MGGLIDVRDLELSSKGIALIFKKTTGLEIIVTSQPTIAFI